MIIRVCSMILSFVLLILGIAGVFGSFLFVPSFEAGNEDESYGWIAILTTAALLVVASAGTFHKSLHDLPSSQVDFGFAAVLAGLAAALFLVSLTLGGNAIAFLVLTGVLLGNLALVARRRVVSRPVDVECF